MIHWNWGKILAGAMAIQSLGCAIGFWYVGEYRKAAYWVFACGINSTFVF